MPKQIAARMRSTEVGRPWRASDTERTAPFTGESAKGCGTHWLAAPPAGEKRKGWAARPVAEHVAGGVVEIARVCHAVIGVDAQAQMLLATGPVARLRADGKQVAPGIVPEGLDPAKFASKLFDMPLDFW